MARSIFKYVLVGLFGFCPQISKTQITISPPPNSWESRIDFERNISSGIDSFFTTIQPLNIFETSLIEKIRIDSLKVEGIFFKEKWVGRKLFNEPLIQKKEQNFQITINPILSVHLGKDFKDKTEPQILFHNSRGFQIYGRIGKNLAYYSDFIENQSLFPDYINEYILTNPIRRVVIVPGQGIPKLFGEKGAWDYAYVNGKVSYQANNFFNFELGRGKNFIGDGYRSLLLSDNTFNYPYLKIQTSFWKIRYTNLFTQMQDLSKTYPDRTYLKKYSSIHYLSINITPKLNVGLFETVVYGDSTGQRGYDINYLNPVIFYRPIEFAIGSSGGNVLMGLSLKYQINKKSLLFSQFILDEFKMREIRKGDGWRGTKYGLQIGGRVYEPLKIKGVTIHSEVNLVRPYTYAHKWPINNYSHYEQSLAHPLGANFFESVTHFIYKKERWYGNLQLLYSTKGLDSLGINYGGNIFQSNFNYPNEYGNFIGQGIKTKTIFSELKVGYTINPNYNLNFEIGFRYRKMVPETNSDSIKISSTNFLFFGLRTALYNHYFDF